MCTSAAEDPGYSRAIDLAPSLNPRLGLLSRRITDMGADSLDVSWARPAEPLRGTPSCYVRALADETASAVTAATNVKTATTVSTGLKPDPSLCLTAPPLTGPSATPMPALLPRLATRLPFRPLADRVNPGRDRGGGSANNLWNPPCHSASW